jgi:hypothetical protein
MITLEWKKIGMMLQATAVIIRSDTQQNSDSLVHAMMLCNQVNCTSQQCIAATQVILLEYVAL